jgi:hypothetical protein
VAAIRITRPNPSATLTETAIPTKGDHFGATVALAAGGALAVVGAAARTVDGRPDEGQIYLFPLNGSHPGTPTVISDPHPGPEGDDSFGAALAVSRRGTTVIVGAPTQGGGTGNGAAYIYARTTSGTWERQAVLAPPAPAPLGQSRFGTAVALSASGDEAAVTALQTSPNDYGAVYLYTRSPAGTWSRVKQLSPGVSDNDGFGASVSMSAGGGTVVVGAPTWEYDGTYPGAVFVFEADTTGTWMQTAVLAVPGPTGFGTGSEVSLSAAGTTALVASSPNSRRARVFVKKADGWTQTAVLGEPARGFGSSIALAGNASSAVVGADESSDGAARSGTGYVFAVSGGRWKEVSRLTVPSPLDNMVFGAAVATTTRGGVRLVGAPGEQPGGTEREVAYLYG